MAVIMSKQMVIPSKFKPALEDNTWEQIAEASAMGIAPDLWPVGSTKWITINGKVGDTTFSNLRVQVFILGHNHNSAIEGENKIHFGLGKIGGVDVALCDSNYNKSISTPTSGMFVYHTSSSSDDSTWSSCNMRKAVLGSDSTPTSPTANTLLAALPADLRAVMKSVTKYSHNGSVYGSAASYVTSTTEFLLCWQSLRCMGQEHLLIVQSKITRSSTIISRPVIPK